MRLLVRDITELRYAVYSFGIRSFTQWIFRFSRLKSYLGNTDL